MKLLTVVFDGDNGVVVPDNRVASHVNKILDRFQLVDRLSCFVGNGELVNEFRVRVRRGELKHEEIVFEFKGETIKVDERANLDRWPKGMCDMVGKQLVEIMTRRKPNINEPSSTL
jgi:hypothetical protein